MNRLIQGKEVTADRVPLYAGTITSGVAADFVEFTKVYATMVTLKQILADPDNCPVPQDTATKWAVISHILEHVNEKNFGDLATYANRFDLSFRILFFRSLRIQHPELRQHPAYGKGMVELTRYLNS